MGQEQGQGGPDSDTDKSEKLSKQWKEIAVPMLPGGSPTSVLIEFFLRSLAILLPKTSTFLFPPTYPSPNTTSQSSEAELNLTANSQIQYESLWPQVRVSQAQHPKPGDHVSLKHQSINRAKSQENT